MIATILSLLIIKSALGAPFIDPYLTEVLEYQPTASVVVIMIERPCQVLDQMATIPSDDKRPEQVLKMVNLLQELSSKSQTEVMDVIYKSEYKRSFTSFWVTNSIVVKDLTKELLMELEGVSNVMAIRLETTAFLGQVAPPFGLPEIPWGLQRINALAVQARNITGQNIVVGVIDSGVRGTHVALQPNFIGDHGWFDPSGHSLTPTDPTSHGTFVTGIVCGNGVGVAPGAKWMACRGCQGNLCFESDLLACAQFMLCPTDPTGQNPDCSKAPDIINNSWGLAVGGNPFFQDVVNAWRAAGIIPVFAAGNTGPTCGSVQSPSDYQNVIAVGLTTRNDLQASASSRGPAVRTGAIKPDFVAPGERIISSTKTSDQSFGIGSGSSFACPHVVGTIALMLSANPGLTYERIVFGLQSSSVHVNAQGDGHCGGLFDGENPNYESGYGRIDAQAAVNNALRF